MAAGIGRWARSCRLKGVLRLVTSRRIAPRARIHVFGVRWFTPEDLLLLIAARGALVIEYADVLDGPARPPKLR